MRTLKGALIALPSGDSVRCIVRNISETGACLELQNPLFLHPTFALLFDDPDWAQRPCYVIWRKIPLIGVEFGAPEPEGGPIRQAIRKLLARAGG